MTRKQAFFVAIVFGLTSAVYAAEVDMQLNLNKVEFEATRAHLIEHLNSDRYTAIAPKDKGVVIAALDRIEARLGKAGSMNDQDRVDTFNDQEIINTITSHAAAESRLFFERDATTGSHRVHIICLTMAKWMEREHTGQTAMYKIEHDHNSTCSVCSK